MALIEIMPLVVAAGLIATMLFIAVGDGAPKKNVWIFPAVLSLLFLGWSLAAVAVEGPFGFWKNHILNLWGNQVWFDLLFAVGIGWALIARPAKALGMTLLPWLVIIISTGCIGFLAMVSRFLFLKENRPTALQA